MFAALARMFFAAIFHFQSSRMQPGPSIRLFHRWFQLLQSLTPILSRKERHMRNDANKLAIVLERFQGVKSCFECVFIQCAESLVQKQESTLVFLLVMLARPRASARLTIKLSSRKDFLSNGFHHLDNYPPHSTPGASFFIHNQKDSGHSFFSSWRLAWAIRISKVSPWANCLKRFPLADPIRSSSAL